MATKTQRRVEWTEAATDYVLEHGLIGLSLRPLAAELGTSDRMLLYHFGSKDELVAAGQPVAAPIVVGVEGEAGVLEQLAQARDVDEERVVVAERVVLLTPCRAREVVLREGLAGPFGKRI